MPGCYPRVRVRCRCIDTLDRKTGERTLGNLISELKRRNVFRVAALYVVGSWLILQIGDLLFDLMGLPDFALRIVLGILLLGFPAALVLAWIYELTPEGVKRERDVDRSGSISGEAGRKLNLAVLVAVALALGALALDRWMPAQEMERKSVSVTTANTDTVPSSSSGPDSSIDAIAVLPFEDFSQSRDQGYLAEGIADTILHALAQVDGLKVAARTSSFRLAEQGADIATVGERLKVGAVLEGSVQKADNQLRIIAQLVQVADESHLWSQTFDRPTGDIFAIQDEIAAAVIKALGQEQGAKEIATVAHQRTSPELYERFLEGRSLWRQRTVESTERAVALLREVVARDPDFAPGHSELAQAVLINASYTSSRDAVTGVVGQLAERALELDPGDAAALRVLGILAEIVDGDTERMEALFRRSLEVNPNDPTTHTYFANTLSEGARWSEAAIHYRAAVALDPLDIYARARLANFLAGFGNDRPGALAVVRETISLAPEDIQTWEAAADVYDRLGRNADAVRARFRRVQLDPASPLAIRSLAWSLARIGTLDTAERWLGLARQHDPSIAEPCDWYMEADPARAMACTEAAVTANPSNDTLYDHANALWINGRDAEALEAFEELIERTAEDRARGFSRYSDLVALLARLMLKPGLDKPVTDADREEPRQLLDMIAGQTPVIDRWSRVHVLAAEGQAEEAATLMMDLPMDFFFAQRVGELPLFDAVRRQTVVAEKLAAYGAHLETERADLAANSDPLILDPPATVEALLARLTES